ncbi:MAG: HlyD family type I secretion periplasmic adaptor subunit [Rhodospirillales bacterium]|nr:HlyD family type I secretion periplasmic adaptor subunit [Rhodospirillales bacterium]
MTVPAQAPPVAAESGLALRQGHLRRYRWELRRTITAGTMTIVLFFSGIGGWAALWPLGSAAVASGELVVEGNAKTVQHLEGGIVADILVREGDRVERGQTLLRLDVTQPKAVQDGTRGRLLAALTQAARITAERESRSTLTLPAEVEAARAEPAITEMILAQQRLLDSRRRSLDDQEAVLRRRIAETHEEIRGLKAQSDSARTQLGLNNNELAMVRELVGKGLAPRPRQLALERSRAQLQGVQGELTARGARAEQAISETELQIRALRSQADKALADEGREVQAALEELGQRLAVARDTLARTEVVAPAAGTIANLQIFTTGGVIASGQPLMEIVPDDRRLMLEIKVKPEDVNQIAVGALAEIRLTSLDRRRFDERLTGRLAYLAAIKSEPKVGQPADTQRAGGWYLARVAFDLNQTPKLKTVPLYPGMPGLAVIPTRQRTALEYFLEPLLLGLEGAFKD